MIKRTSIAVSILIFAQLLSGCGGGGSSKHHSTTYTAHELESKDVYDNYAYSINDDGIISGRSVNAVTWTLDGKLTELESFPAPSDSQANKINSTGLVAGYVQINGWYSASTWTSDGSLTLFKTPDGFDSAKAVAVNSQGYVVGTAGTDPSVVFSPYRAFIWTPDNAPVELDLIPDGAYSTASDINDQGQIVGNCEVPKENTIYTYATEWTLDGKATKLPTLPNWNTSFAKAINNSGFVVGECWAGGLSHAVLWTPQGNPKTLGELPGYNSSSAEAINDAGQVVGYVMNEPSGPLRAVLWNPDGSIVSLGNNSDSACSEATGINNHGQIVGQIEYSNHRKAVLWLPK